MLARGTVREHLYHWLVVAHSCLDTAVVRGFGTRDRRTGSFAPC